MDNSTGDKSLIKSRIVEKIQKGMAGGGTHIVSQGIRSLKCNNFEVEEIQEKANLMENKYNETFEALSEVRGTVLDLSEQVLEKEFRITHLEKNLHEYEKKIKKQEDKLNEWENRLAREKEEIREENEVLQNQVSRLCKMLAERDERILLQCKENSRLTTESKDIKNKNKELMAQLDAAVENLKTLVSEYNEREKMLNNLEADLKRKQTERHALYLNEINRNKRMFINIKVKENLMSQIIYDKNNQITELSKQVKELKDKLEKITTTFRDVSITKNDTKHQTLAISNSSNKKVQCTVTSPCNMKMVNGMAKITI